MKRLVSLLLAGVMCVSLAACGGGVDKQPAIDAHNAAGAAVNELTAIINADPDSYAEYVSDMQELVNQLNQCGDYLANGKDIEQDALDEWVTVCKEIEQWAKDAKAEIEAAPAPAPESGGEGPTEEQLNTLKQLYNQIADAYNDAADKAQENGWLEDEQTSVELNTVLTVMEPVGEMLSAGTIDLSGEDCDQVIEQFRLLVPALEEMADKVSVPYEG